MQIVTAIYFGQPEFPYYTWPWEARLQRYLYSLIQLTKMEIPIVCYVNDFTEPLVKKLNLKNLTIINKHLKEFEYSDSLKTVKSKHKEEEQYLQSNLVKMYHEVDYGKLSILRDHYLDNEYTYWIDSGLSYWSLWPNKYNPNTIDGMSHTITNYEFNGVFNKELIPNINKFLGDKLICIGNRRAVNSLIYNTFNEVVKFNMIGGIIGGNKKYIHTLLEEFNKLATEMFNKNTIINHEALLSVIATRRPELFKTYLFDTWYHEDSNVEEDEDLVRFSNFVEHIK